MKKSDDYNAKLEIWARESRVHPLPRPLNVPKFSAKKFKNYEEMNEWKHELLEEIACSGGLKWSDGVTDDNRLRLKAER